MRRGTTPIHTFTLPVDASQIEKVRINYAQARNLVLVKTEQDAVEFKNNVIKIRLSQKDTLQFSSNMDVEIQMDILEKTGDTLRSEVLRVDVDRCLNEEELV